MTDVVKLCADYRDGIIVNMDSDVAHSSSNRDRFFSRLYVHTFIAYLDFSRRQELTGIIDLNAFVESHMKSIATLLINE